MRFISILCKAPDQGEPRMSWAAVHATELTTGVTRKLTPYGIADFILAFSPFGVYTTVAFYGERGWNGEVEELNTNIYIFLTCDGTNRVKATLPNHGPILIESMIVEQVTPPGLHAFTPATFPGQDNMIMGCPCAMQQLAIRKCSIIANCSQPSDTKI
ncbi:hypothetical protein D5086_024094 [Populus alba]|uniref:Uncharacterized protein n=1 Tax=Populus alba TaxID=43335 RepID=A0ACC4B542_POPAL